MRNLQIDPKMLVGARKLVDMCAEVQKGEQVLVVTDGATDPRIAQAITVAAEERGAHPQTVTLENHLIDSGEPPESVAAAMKEAAVIFAPVNISITHTRAVKNACEAGSRVLALTQWLPEMLVSGGIDADFRAIEPLVRKMARIWDEGETVHVKTEAGTDMVMDIRGRFGTPHAKTGIVRAGEFSPVPTIESPVSPVTGEGTIVCDASFPYLGIGVPDEPIIAEVKDGNVVSLKGGRDADTIRKAWEAMNDPNVYNLAEIGIGMNPHCRIIGSMLEDEGVDTTCHFGIGTSDTLGGVIKAACHFDFVIHDPTITVDGRVVMKRGVLQI